jgi:uncharacterized membrane protein
MAIFALFTVVSVAGYAVFGRNPQLVAELPGAMDVYVVAFAFFARAHVLLSFVVLAAALYQAGRARWIPSLIAVYAISLGSEMAGTTAGIPFGPYRYTEGLGPMWFGHVPLLIPLSWFVMAVPSYALAGAFLDALRRRTVAARVVIASAILLAWDLALDPAMSFATKYWVWGSEGPYYGMPWLNLAGWYLTGLAIMGVLAALRADRWLDTVPVRWTVSFYAVNLLLPLGICAAAGLWGAVAVTIGVLALLPLAVMVERRTARGALVSQEAR